MSNGKDPNAVTSRVNVNTQRKEYQHKHPLVDLITSGKANNVKMAGQQLVNLLLRYDVDFVVGDTKVLGNSDVEVDMRAERGVKVGYFRKRKSI